MIRLTGQSQNVVLEWYEMLQATEIGRMRKMHSLSKGLSNNHGFNEIGWNEDIEGACAEQSVAKALGLYWDGGIDTFKAGDVGPYQVRWTKSHSNSLIIRKPDNDQAVYILVTGLCPSYILQGWLRGHEAQRDEWLRDPNKRVANWFVPISALHPMSTLPPVDSL